LSVIHDGRDREMRLGHSPRLLATAPLNITCSFVWDDWVQLRRALCDIFRESV
jgi:hypothetical protein